MSRKNVNEYIEPWVTCPICDHPIRGEHSTFKFKWGVFAQYELVIHTDCKSRMIENINRVEVK